MEHTLEHHAYKFRDYQEGASSTDLEVELNIVTVHHAENTQRRKRFHIILGVIIAICVVGGAVGGGIVASSSKNNEATSVEAVVNSGSDSDKDSSPVSTISPNGPVPTAAPATSFPTVHNADEIKDAILTVAREGGAEFENPDSYQSKALAYVQGQTLPAPKIPLNLDEQAIQLYALACIYYNTYSVSSVWTDFLYGEEIEVPGWLTAIEWVRDSNEVCSSWWGITCNSNGQVEELKLNENGLTGYIPPETAILHVSLKSIDLYDNIIHNKGDIGHSFLGELTNLEKLFYRKTYFEYAGIPSAISQLTKLLEYDCSFTLYAGPLQGSTFAPLTNLVYLDIRGNTYNSPLPEELITLPELKFLYAGFSSLQGDLGFVHRMPKIVEMWLDDNPSMKGTIPTTIGLASTLAGFGVTNCALFGPLPTEIGNMLKLEVLWLYDNHLTGDIPTELNNLKNLRILNLQKNDLLGELPPAMCNKFDPSGKLEELEADCDEVTCTCCTCCGAGCIDDDRTRKNL
jgi:hypothetical protein